MAGRKADSQYRGDYAFQSSINLLFLLKGGSTMKERKLHSTHIDPYGVIFRTASPWARCPKMAGGSMKCYRLARHCLLFPTIPVSRLDIESKYGLWSVELGSNDQYGTYNQIPLPQNTKVVENPEDKHYGRVREVPLAGGRFLLFIEDLSFGEGYWKFLVVPKDAVLAEGLATHGNGFEKNCGREALLQLLPGDKILIEIVGITGNEIKFCEIRASDSMLSMVVGYGQDRIVTSHPYNVIEADGKVV